MHKSLNFLYRGGIIFLFLFGFIWSSALANEDYNGQIKGTVTTIDGRPASWVTVQIKGSAISTITDENGTFYFKNLKPGNYTLIVTYPGSEPSEKTIIVTEDKIANTEFTLQQTFKELNEIVIDGRKSSNLQPATIGKIPVAPMDLPMSISVIGQNILRNQQVEKLSDVIKNVNGIYLSSERGGEREIFSARGYRLTTDNIYKNGVRSNFSVMPEMSSIESVEILKGSAAILYGAVAPGGIINMITKKPKFEYGGEISMRTGSYGLYKPVFDVYGPVSKKIAFRLDGTFEDEGSFRDEVHSKKYYINPSLKINFGEKTKLLLQGDYFANNFNPDFGLGTLSDTIVARLPRNVFLGASWQYDKIRQSTATATLNHKFNEAWELNVTGSYQNYNKNYYSTERIRAAANGDWARPLNRILTSENYYLAEADLTGKFRTGGINHVLLAGMDADRDDVINYTFNNPTIYDTINILDHSKFVQRTDIPPASKITRTTTPVNRVGIYIQDLISISNKIKLLAGIRWSELISQPVLVNYLTKDSVAKNPGQNNNAFSPRVGLVYKPLTNTAVFVSYSNSFSVNTGTDIFNNPLPPSIINQYEMGVKNDFFNGQLSVNITAYRIRNSNLAQTAPFLQDGVTPNSNTNLKELTGQTTSDGIELDISGHPVRGLDIMAGYSYNNMRYTKTPDSEGSYIEGEKLIGTPAHTANATAFYNFQNKLKGLKVGATLFTVGNRLAGFNNKKGQAQNYSRLITVSGFTTLDLSAGYTFKKISLLAQISNVTNTYNFYVHENYSVNPIPPTQFRATVSYRF